jgi:uncharacterized cupredoxin-like copper-binding protein
MPSPLRALPVAAALAGAAALAAGCGNSTSASSDTPKAASPSAAAGAIRGTLDEWSVGVSSARAAAGKVTFTVHNAGRAPHEFVVLRTDKPAAGLGGGSRVSEKGNVGETGDIASGASKSVTLDLRPGHYSLVCNLPGHYKLGMHTDFTVG